MKKEIKLQERENVLQVKETYISPDIEIVVIETEQNILAGGSGDAPKMPPTIW